MDEFDDDFDADGAKKTPPMLWELDEHGFEKVLRPRARTEDDGSFGEEQEGEEQLDPFWGLKSADHGAVNPKDPAHARAERVRDAVDRGDIVLSGIFEASSPRQKTPAADEDDQIILKNKTTGDRFRVAPEMIPEDLRKKLRNQPGVEGFKERVKERLRVVKEREKKKARAAEPPAGALVGDESWVGFRGYVGREVSLEHFKCPPLKRKRFPCLFVISSASHQLVISPGKGESLL